MAIKNLHSNVSVLRKGCAVRVIEKLVKGSQIYYLRQLAASPLTQPIAASRIYQPELVGTSCLKR